MLRRRCGVVIDEEYVQEHILTGGNVAPLEAPRQLVNGSSAISLGVVVSHPTHLFRSGRFCPAFERRRRSQQCNALNHIATLLTKRMRQMIDGGLRSV
jgi:hypothetical protein